MGTGNGRYSLGSDPLLDLLVQPQVDPADGQATSTTPSRLDGAHGLRDSALPECPLPTFADVDRRAERLIEWARTESAYIRSHDVRRFSARDRAGRDYFADEGLYLLLPALRRDAARLGGACGPGPMWAHTRDLVTRAGRAVQAYHRLWRRMHDEALQVVRVQVAVRSGPESFSP